MTVLSIAVRILIHVLAERDPKRVVWMFWTSAGAASTYFACRKKATRKRHGMTLDFSRATFTAIDRKSKERNETWL